MKMQKQIDRERIFGKTPDMVTYRLKHTLTHLEEEPPMKKKSVSILVIALLLVLAGVAYAAGAGGLKWYYENRVDYAGRLPADLQERIQTDIPQTEEEENPLATVVVTGAAWLGKGIDTSYPNHDVLDIHINAIVRDSGTYEMVDSSCIDADGVRAEPERIEENPEFADRFEEAWMWAYGKKGPLDVVMKDATKALLIYGRMTDCDIWVEGRKDVPLPIHSYDMYMDEETGQVVANYNLRFDEGEIAQLWQYADKEGNIKLVYESWAAPFVDIPNEPQWENGTVTFSIKLPQQ